MPEDHPEPAPDPGPARKVRQNVEIKARLRRPDLARQVARAVATDQGGTLSQVDTYFHCRHGRLKLREIDGQDANLIWYERENRPDARPSRYCLIPAPDPVGLKLALTAALGVKGVVRKQRELYLYHNVRIHLDQVSQIGSFLELESVLSEEIDEVDGREQIERLLATFQIKKSDLTAESYVDMA
jgi:adenylate cyclase class IV